ncbi:MAG: DNA-binding protein WhiA [Finegoldia sp.]|nr:DNA-binding protein WhiA [Finegoldia sp.]
MSFSSDIKMELLGLALNRDESIAALCALARTIGTITYRTRGNALIFKTESNPVARWIYTRIKNIYSYECDIRVSQSNNLRKKKIFEVLVDFENINEVFKDLDLSPSPFESNSRVKEDLLDSDEKKKAYLMGAFLGTGYTHDPNKRYQLEISMKNEASCLQVEEISEAYGIKGNVFQRNDFFVFYIKEAEMISDFLALIKAYNSVLRFEDIRAMKDIKNNVNRRVNFETANLNKTIDASFNQRLIIEKIDKRIGIENLDKDLLDLAEVRIKNPDMSLKELGESMDPPLTKSQVNYRLNKLKKIAEEI